MWVAIDCRSKNWVAVLKSLGSIILRYKHKTKFWPPIAWPHFARCLFLVEEREAIQKSNALKYAYMFRGRIKYVDLLEQRLVVSYKKWQATTCMQILSPVVLMFSCKELQREGFTCKQKVCCILMRITLVKDNPDTLISVTQVVKSCTGSCPIFGECYRVACYKTTGDFK
jgi:hypothetical protein